jgi:FkbM family methyltransferase
VKYRTHGNTEILPIPDMAHQYFPNDIPAWSSPIRFIDCGAYDGDTLRNALNLGIKFENIALFEPDHSNFNSLIQFISKRWDTPACCWPCGVYSSTDHMHFALKGGEGGKLHAASNNIIQVVALDDVLYGFRPNLIKMDIEGAEIEALLGAKRQIIENKPGLAISVYHHPRHLWQIPLMVKTWNLDYRFYLRMHGHNGFETVMYAIPGEI